MEDCVPPYDHSYSEDIYEIIVMSAASQNKLGWKLFIESKIINSWAFIQEEYFQSMENNRRTRKTGQQKAE